MYIAVLRRSANNMDLPEEYRQPPVINAQPQPEGEPHYIHDYDGEEVVFEATCEVENLQSDIRHEYNQSIITAAHSGVGLLPLCIWCAIAIPMGRYCG